MSSELQLSQQKDYLPLPESNSTPWSESSCSHPIFRSYFNLFRFFKSWNSFFHIILLLVINFCTGAQSRYPLVLRVTFQFIQFCSTASNLYPKNQTIVPQISKHQLLCQKPLALHHLHLCFRIFINMYVFFCSNVLCLILLINFEQELKTHFQPLRILLFFVCQQFYIQFQYRFSLSEFSRVCRTITFFH